MVAITDSGLLSIVPGDRALSLGMPLVHPLFFSFLEMKRGGGGKIGTCILSKLIGIFPQWNILHLRIFFLLLQGVMPFFPLFYFKMLFRKITQVIFSEIIIHRVQFIQFFGYSCIWIYLYFANSFNILIKIQLGKFITQLKNILKKYLINF